ncbi:hypothetical protein ACFX13_045987 [Malus domestica]
MSVWSLCRATGVPALAEWKSGRGRRDLRWGVDEEGIRVYQMGFQGSGGVGGSTESDGGGDCDEGSAGGDCRKKIKKGHDVKNKTIQKESTASTIYHYGYVYNIVQIII